VPKGCVEKVQPEVRANFETALEHLKSFADVTLDVPWPDFPWGPSVGTIVNAEGAAAFRGLIESGDVEKLKCPADRIGGYSAALTFAVDYIEAMRVRVPMQRAVKEFFTKFDVVASPGRAAVAPPIAKKFRDAYPGVSGGPGLIPAGNLCGLPAVCVPSGFGQNGLPTSIALMGPAFSEKRLLEAASWFQRRTDWHGRQPPVG
jgi:aspartyl-tRNA(Asn)/glutamyl-tRNA(Gln) amidotransferase subunit A